jgi:hypothetical protein
MAGEIIAAARSRAAPEPAEEISASIEMSIDNAQYFDSD